MDSNADNMGTIYTKACEKENKMNEKRIKLVIFAFPFACFGSREEI